MRFVNPVLISWMAASLSLAGLSARSSSVAAADDVEQEAEQQAALERRERYLEWMRTFAEGTKIVLKDQDKDQDVQIVPNPVFRYSDEERLIPDATLWVWTRDGRPVAIQKVEGNNHGGGRQWTICFASLSEGLLKTNWPSGRRYESQTPGVTFKPIPMAAPPSDKPRLRAAELKSLKDRFSGRLSVDGAGKGGAETRTIARPIYEYDDPASGLPRGAIFGVSSTGTNPDLLLLIEARSDEDGNERWEYAHARMTSTSLILRLDDVDVWSETSVPTSNAVFANWTFYFLPRGFQ